MTPTTTQIYYLCCSNVAGIRTVQDFPKPGFTRFYQVLIFSYKFSYPTGRQASHACCLRKLERLHVMILKGKHMKCRCVGVEKEAASNVYMAISFKIAGNISNKA